MSRQIDLGTDSPGRVGPTPGAHLGDGCPTPWLIRGEAQENATWAGRGGPKRGAPSQLLKTVVSKLCRDAG